MNPLIRNELAAWFATHGRELPWRGTRDPYRIWVSEVILQQTRVAQGWAYYERFIERFPDVKTLATASENEVLRAWQGLGYYSRARNLHAASKQVVDRHGGEFPSSYAAVRALSGIGNYTAAAITSIAFDAPYAVVDGNVYRVLSRIFDIDTPIDTTEGRKIFTELAQELLDKQNPGLYNQAIMDFGAVVCTPKQPKCDDCPLESKCLARAHGTIDVRPVKRGRGTVKELHFNYFHVTCGDQMLLRQRTERDIWQGLYELPQQSFPGGTLRSTTPMPPHKLTHRTIHATIHHIELPRLPDTGYLKIKTSDLDDYPLPRLLEKYFSFKSSLRPSLF